MSLASNEHALKINIVFAGSRIISEYENVLWVRPLKELQVMRKLPEN